MIERSQHALPRAALLAATAVLAGCAAGSAALRVPAGYVKNPFAPVNLYVNANEQLGFWDAELVEHVAAQLEQSGAFVRVDRGVQRWPSTLQLRYRWEYGTDPADTVARIGSWITLGLVPVKITKIHRLEAEIFLEPEPVASLTYADTAVEWVSVYTIADANADERQAVNRLLENMLAEIAAHKLVPRAREVNDPPPRRPRKQPV